VKVSDLCELAGFAVLAYAAWLLAPIAGLIAAGLFLLLIGYAVSDEQAVVQTRRVVDPLRARRAGWKAKRTARRAEKTKVT